MTDRRRGAWLVSALMTLGCGPAVDDSTTSTAGMSGSSVGGDGSSTTAAQDVSDDGADSSSTGGPILPPGCRDYMGRATPAQTAMTPRPDPEAEVLAIEASGEIVAPQPLYDRIVTELAAIRAAEPGLVAVKASSEWPLNAIEVSLDEEGRAAYDAGTFDAWDCPNALYHVTETEDGFLGSVIVRFAGLYDVLQVDDDYRMVEHVVEAGVVTLGGDGPDVCLSIAGDVHTYIFDDARGDCPAGCTEHVYTGFTVDADGTITPLGSYDPVDPVPPPFWFEVADDCTAWL